MYQLDMCYRLNLFQTSFIHNCSIFHVYGWRLCETILHHVGWVSLKNKNKIVMLLKWQSSISIFSQIWWYSKYESKKNLEHLFSYCRQLWQFIFFDFGEFFSKIGTFWENIYFPKYLFQNCENSPPKTPHVFF